MNQRIAADPEKNARRDRIRRTAAIAGVTALTVAALVLAILSLAAIFKSNRSYRGNGMKMQYFVLSDPGDYGGGKCRVEFTSADGNYTYSHTYTFEEWKALPENAGGYNKETGVRTTVTGYVFETDDGTYAVFSPDHRAADKPFPTEPEILSALRAARTRKAVPLIVATAATLLAAIGFAVALSVNHLKKMKGKRA